MRYSTVSCLLFLALTSACESGKSSHQQEPDAVRDLLVDRVFWKRLPAPGQPGVLIDQHQFSITNTSGQYSYKQIQVRFDYYDSTFHRISTRKHVIDQLIEPRSAAAILPVQAGKTNPAARSATVTIDQAVSE